MKHFTQRIVASLFLITRIFMCMNRMFADPNEKCTRPKKLRKEIIGRDGMLLQNSGTRLGMEWSGNWQIAYQHESPDHSISCEILWQEGRRRSKGRDEGGSKCTKHDWFHAFKEIALFKRFPFYMCLLMLLSIEWFS